MFLCHHRDEDGDDEEGEEGRDGEAEDDGGAEGAPEGVGESDGDESENRGERGDEDCFDPGSSGVDNSFIEVESALPVEIYFVNQNDGVFDDDAEEREYADQTGEGEWHAEDCHADKDADHREREGDKNNR